MKCLSREEFRKQVFQRDQYKCVICGEAGVHKAAIYLKENYPDTPIYIPYHMGCGLAKGDWSSVLDALSLLDEHLTIVRLVSF